MILLVYVAPAPVWDSLKYVKKEFSPKTVPMIDALKP